MPVDLKPFAGPEHLPFTLPPLAAGQPPRTSAEAPGALLIHGFPGTPAEMRPLGEPLSAAGWHAHGLLLPGFGPQIPDLDHYTNHHWLAAAADAWQNLSQAARPTTIIGYSMGAALALKLAAQVQPERLVLISPFWRANSLLAALVPVVRLLRFRLYPFKKADFSSPRLRQQFNLIIPNADLDDPEVQSTIREQFSIPVNALDEILRLGRDGYRAAKKLALPALIIQGDKDPIVTPKNTQKLARALERGALQLHEIPGSHDLLQNAGALATVQALVGAYLLE